MSKAIGAPRGMRSRGRGFDKIVRNDFGQPPGWPRSGTSQGRFSAIPRRYACKAIGAPRGMRIRVEGSTKSSGTILDNRQVGRAAARARDGLVQSRFANSFSWPEGPVPGTIQRNPSFYNEAHAACECSISASSNKNYRACF